MRPEVKGTLGIFCADALEAFKKDDQGWRDKVRRDKLIARIVDGGQHDLTSEEIGRLVEHVGQHPVTRVASECVRMLDLEAWTRA